MNTNAYADQHCFDLFTKCNQAQPSNWTPCNCKYLTLDEVTLHLIHPYTFNITQLNTRSLKKNFESFKSCIESFKILPQIITVAETWLKENDQVYYEIPNYKFLSLSRNIYIYI